MPIATYELRFDHWGKSLPFAHYALLQATRLEARRRFWTTDDAEKSEVQVDASNLVACVLRLMVLPIPYHWSVQWYFHAVVSLGKSITERVKDAQTRRELRPALNAVAEGLVAMLVADPSLSLIDLEDREILENALNTWEST